MWPRSPHGWSASQTCAVFKVPTHLNNQHSTTYDAESQLKCQPALASVSNAGMRENEHPTPWELFHRTQTGNLLSAGLPCGPILKDKSGCITRTLSLNDLTLADTRSKGISEGRLPSLARKARDQEIARRRMGAVRHNEGHEQLGRASEAATDALARAGRGPPLLPALICARSSAACLRHTAAPPPDGAALTPRPPQATPGETLRW